MPSKSCSRSRGVPIVYASKSGSKWIVSAGSSRCIGSRVARRATARHPSTSTSSSSSFIDSKSCLAGCVRTENTGIKKKCWATSRPPFLDGRPPASWPSKRPIGGEHLALLGKGNPLLHRRPDPKELAHFIEGTAEARGLGHAAEPTHGGIALLDATVILLQSIVEGAVGPVKHVTAQGLADGTRVGVMPIGCHPFWGVTNHIDGLRRSKR